MSIPSRLLHPVLLFTCLALLAAPALAEGTTGAGSLPQDAGSAAYAKGYTALKQGRIDEAAKHFLAAASAVPDNATYMQQALGLRKVQGLRRLVAKDSTSDKWVRAVRSLHLFYVQNGLGTLAVEVDRIAYERLRDVDSATWLAEAHLEAGQNVEAANLAASIENASPQLATYHALALARLGRLDDARRVPGTAPAEDATARALFDAARLRAALGDAPRSLALLRTSFEKTPAAALSYARERAKTSPDLKGLAALPAFAEVLRTESKVKQTCSGGSSCSSCPNRGSCGGGK